MITQFKFRQMIRYKKDSTPEIIRDEATTTLEFSPIGLLSKLNEYRKNGIPHP